MKRTLLSVGISLFLITYLHAQTKMSRQLDQLITSVVPQNEPGIVVLIARKNQVIYEKAFGSANLELKVPLQPDMVFRIGSVTKQFTAIGILQLLEQGKLSLSDNLQHYLPDFPAKGATITIEQLLTHTSGIPDYASIDSPEPFIERWDFTPGYLTDHFKNASLLFPPGSRYSYSNSNYLLLAQIIEKVSGQPYRNYMEQKVIRAAGLTHTRYAPEKTIVAGRVTGYTRDNGFFENCDYQTLSMGYGCGDLLSSAEDLYQWNNALLAGKLVRKETLEKAFSPHLLRNGAFSSYGYGWIVDQQQGRACIHHEGQVSGFIASEKYFPEDALYLVMLTNVKSGEDKTTFSEARFNLMADITRVALGEAVPTEIKLSSKALEQYTGTYQVGKQTIDIRPGKGVLNANASMEGNFQLVPVGGDQFIIRNANPACIVDFVKDSAGGIVEMISFQKASFDWLKVATPQASPIIGPDSLQAYAGKYQLPTMRNGFMMVRTKDNHLFLSSTTPVPDAELLPLGGGKFRYFGNGMDFPLQFVRQADGNIEKLIMTQAPVHCPKIK